MKHFIIVLALFIIWFSIAGLAVLFFNQDMLQWFLR